MEVRVNKEISEYEESMFFGLSLRQFVFSVIGCLVAAGLFILLKPVLGMETASWICIIGAFPFALLGFLTYNKMPAERFLIAWFKSEFLLPKHLSFGNTNLYSKLLGEVDKDEKREKIRTMFHINRGKGIKREKNNKKHNKKR